MKFDKPEEAKKEPSIKEKLKPAITSFSTLYKTSLNVNETNTKQEIMDQLNTLGYRGEKQRQAFTRILALKTINTLCDKINEQINEDDGFENFEPNELFSKFSTDYQNDFYFIDQSVISDFGTVFFNNWHKENKESLSELVKKMRIALMGEVFMEIIDKTAINGKNEHDKNKITYSEIEIDTDENSPEDIVSGGSKQIDAIIKSIIELPDTNK